MPQDVVVEGSLSRTTPSNPDLLRRGFHSPEILVLIFEYAVLSHTVRQRDGILRSIRNVSSNWRRLADSTPILWTTICIRPSIPPGMSGMNDDGWLVGVVKRAKIFLAKAARQRVTFDIVLTADWHTYVHQNEALKTLQNLMLEASAKWHSVRVTGCGAVSELVVRSQPISQASISNIFLVHGCSMFTDVQSLNVYYTPGSLCLAIPENQISHFLSDAKIARVIKHAVKLELALRCSRCVFSTISHASFLTWSPQINPEHLKHLRDLSITWSRFSFSDVDDGVGFGYFRITLPSLETLTIKGDGEHAIASSTEVFRHLRLPRCRQLSVKIGEVRLEDAIHDMPQPWCPCDPRLCMAFWRSLTELIQASACSLRSITIQDVPVADPDIANDIWNVVLLQPSVRRLDIPLHFFTRKLAENFVSDGSQPGQGYPFPVLSIIGILDASRFNGKHDELRLHLDNLQYIVAGRRRNQFAIAQLKFSNPEVLRMFRERVDDMDTICVSMVEKGDDEWSNLVDEFSRYSF
ncbi:hypothetical protein BD410DRAFT_844626 [Rickenella mellea]|uniref:F-box domain-containing protein n=1 Tax=Rickenella mellea TaxID=50990 RepID=A0A4Y7PLD8_9AGAM|nr:hypothetical protein BD410DRAFT_844626 [Rickenella mellea]